MKIKKLNRIAPFLCAALVTSAHALPPSSPQAPQSLDPTYGRPLPRKPAVPLRRVPDATWIWIPHAADNQTIYARGRVTLPRAPRRAVLYITADNDFVVYVNGTKVGQTPTVAGDGELWKKVQAIDVTAQLQARRNLIAIQARNTGEVAGLAVRLETDGKLALVSDKKWLVTDTLASDITILGDTTYAERWAGPDFDDTDWSGATEVARVGEGAWGDGLEGWPVPLHVLPDYLAHLPIAPVRWAYAGADPDALAWHDIPRGGSPLRVERPAAASAAAGETGWRMVLDFGKELTGRALVNSATTGLVLGTGESTGEVLAKPWTSTRGTASPYTALRYVSVTVPVHETRVMLTAQMDHLYYPVRYQGSFDCSDPLLTRVWYTGAYTAHLCMQEDIWDAPKRDRWRWMGDLHVSGAVINSVFADRFLMEQTMTRLRHDVQGSAPDSALPRQHINGIPGYSYSWVAGLADFYRHGGDRAYLQSQHDALVSLLAFCCQNIDTHGDFTNTHNAWVYVDWSPDFTKEGPLARATTQLFLVKALNEGAFLLRELDDDTNAHKYAAVAQQVGEAARAHLVAPDGTFSRRKQENAMAIWAGVATPAQTRAIFDTGIFTPETAPTEPVVSPYYGNYVLGAMGIAGRTQDGLDYVRSFWGQMVKDGATTFYETYDPLWNKQNFHAHLQWDEHDNDAAGYHVSLCHGWSAGPTTFLTEYVLGVRSTGAGFKTCTIAPRPGDLKWASGTVPTPRGPIQVRVERQPAAEPTGLTLRVTVPKGTTATVTLPTAIRTINGKPVPQNAPVELGPGVYTVTGS